MTSGTRGVIVAGLVTLAFTACFYNEPRVFTDNPRLVPDLVEERVEDANDVLEADGFLVVVTTPDEQRVDPANCPDEQVIAQDPPGGEGVVKASTITLTVDSC